MAVFTRRRSKPGAGLTAALASVFLLAMTGTAQANVVLPPMYFLFLFSHPLGLLVLFLVVLALEAVSARHVLKEPWKVCVGVSLHANLCSTCFGFPLAFLAETVVGWMIRPLLDAFFAGWGTWSGWGSPVALGAVGVLGMLPFFLLSVWIERYAAKAFVSEQALPRLRRWSWMANLWSYGFLLALLVGTGIMA